MKYTVRRLIKSVWLFPVLLLFPLLVFTTQKISGSSVGVIHNILYGDEVKDHALKMGKPRDIRSDEWLVGTQQTIAQVESNFPRVNKNIGLGQDVSTQDLPYRDWSIIFKPHNLAFFVLPLENAFALKWWLMAYLLLVSCYFFVLALLPDRKLLAIGLSISLLFSGFAQWWYAYGTLGSLYYSLFAATFTILLFKQKGLVRKILWGLLLSYVVACFALVLYPPFQIACGLVLGVFLVSYAIQNHKQWGKNDFIRSCLILFGAGFISVLIAGAFVFTRLSVVKTISSTAYPGVRVIKSGGTSPYHFLSSHMGYQFIYDKTAAKYLIDDKNITNPSEASNFLLLIPFLFLPSLYLLYANHRRKQALDWPLLGMNLLFLIYLVELFVHPFTPVSRLLLLDKVGPGRALIGVGLLNLVLVTLFIRSLVINRKFSFPKIPAAIYCLLVLVIELLVSFHAQQHFDIFITTKRAILFSLPLPIIIYCLMRRWFVAAISLYATFSIFISIGVNPLYRGLGIVTKNPISIAISHFGSTSNKRWATEGGYLENEAPINNEPSLSSVYNYPQFDLWKTIPQAQKDSYNRYAHVGIQLSDDPASQTSLKLITPDSFIVKTNGCSDYLQQLNVGYVLTATVLKGNCTQLIDTLSFPRTTLYIYKIPN